MLHIGNTRLKTSFNWNTSILFQVLYQNHNFCISNFTTCQKHEKILNELNTTVNINISNNKQTDQKEVYVRGYDGGQETHWTFTIDGKFNL